MSRSGSVTSSGSHRVLCFGEMLWDSLPAGLFPGGAPMNVGYHLKQHGLDPMPVSAVGRDRLGRELLRRVAAWGVNTAAVAEHEDLETGFVQASLDSHGNASYEIVHPVAWDRIELLPAALETDASAIVYGSLAQRSQHNRRSLDGLLEGHPNALRVFDVNLRAPFDNLTLVRELAAMANVLKLNDSEAARLCASDSSEDVEALARHLCGATGTPTVCITCGPRGAGLYYKDAWYWEVAQDVKIEDTVGAGDSFLACLTHGLLTSPDTPQENLTAACRIGDFVASQRGATPAYQG